MRSRRGVGTIIGAVFFMFIVISALTMMSHASRQQGSFSATTTEVNRMQAERITSSLEVIEAKIDDGKFNITVQNNGPLTERVVRLWLTNETATDWHNKFETDFVLVPKQAITNIGQNIPVVPTNNDTYRMKFVTERGNLVNYRSLSVAQANLDLSMYISPTTITTGENVTIMMSVTNRERNVDSIHNLQPIIDHSFDCEDEDCPPTLTPGTIPGEIESLARGSTALFKWVYTIEGPPLSEVTFTGTLAGADPGNSVSETVTIVPVKGVAEAVSSELTETLGVIAIDHDSFKWFRTDDNNQNGLNVAGYPAFVAPSGEKLMFSLNFTNKDPQQRDLTISLLTFLQSSVNIKQWFISDGLKSPPDNGKIEPYNNTLPHVILEYDKPVTVYFGSDSVQSESAQVAPANGMEGMFIILDGAFSDGQKYAQNIPFEATYFGLASFSVADEDGNTNDNIGISGTGYSNNAQIDIVWLHGNGSSTILKTVTSTPSGAIPGGTTFTVPNYTAGWYVQLVPKLMI